LDLGEVKADEVIGRLGAEDFLVAALEVDDFLGEVGGGGDLDLLILPGDLGVLIGRSSSARAIARRRRPRAPPPRGLSTPPPAGRGV
jgi:hypothetical protein